MQYTKVFPLRNVVESGYQYVGQSATSDEVPRRREATELSRQIRNPRLTSPDFLVQRARRDILSSWINDLPSENVRVLDVGGRLQPYKPLFAAKAELYVALDPIFEGLLDVAGVGEQLPFCDESFGVVICTQVLSYTKDPRMTVEEIRRVLKPGGILYLTAPAIFPLMHDLRWSFTPEGLASLLSDFADVEIVSEGGSIAGICRTINQFFETFARSEAAHRAFRAALFPTSNVIGLCLDSMSAGRTSFSTNFACRALKPANEH